MSDVGQPTVGFARSSPSIQIIHRQPPTPSDEELSSNEAFYLKRFAECECGFDRNDSTLLMFVKLSQHKFVVSYLFRRFGVNLTSKPVRSAFVLMSNQISYGIFRSNVKTDPFVAKYYAAFCRSTREAIDRKDYAEIAYGCAYMCLYTISSMRPWDEIEIHINGCLSAFENLVDGKGIPMDDAQVFVFLCTSIVMLLVLRFEMPLGTSIEKSSHNCLRNILIRQTDILSNSVKRYLYVTNSYVHDGIATDLVGSQNANWLLAGLEIFRGLLKLALFKIEHFDLF